MPGALQNIERAIQMVDDLVTSDNALRNGMVVSADSFKAMTGFVDSGGNSYGFGRTSPH